MLPCSDLPPSEILLAWSDLIKLGILHPEWPNPPPQMPVAAKAVAPATASPPLNSPASLFQEFPKVLDDDLTANERMKGDYLKIRFKDGPVSPFHATSAWPVPTHLEAPGHALCDDLVRKGVLRLLDENTVTAAAATLSPIKAAPTRPALSRTTSS